MGLSRVLVLSALVALMMAVPTVVVPSASAAPCPDVEVIFARGTHEQPGAGPTGQAFVDALRPRVGDQSLAVYPVDYPANDQWTTGAAGVRDAAARIVSVAATCPNTKMVLGGYSQGAAVAGFVTSAVVPDGVDSAAVPKPLEPEVADHVAAIVLFGLPNERAMNFLREPVVAIGPLYEGKTRELCATDDPVCSDGLNFAVHNPRSYDGELTSQGAAFAASRLNATP